MEAHTKEALTKSIVETFKTYLVPALTSALEDTVANEEVFVADEADAAEAAVEVQARPARFLSFGIKGQNPKIFVNSTDLLYVSWRDRA